MKWCRFATRDEVSFGILDEQYDCVARVEGSPFAGDFCITDDRRPRTSVKLLVPVLPGTFYAVGLNYQRHVELYYELNGQKPRFETDPRVVYRSNSSLVAHDDNIVKPLGSSEHFQYEGELVAVIGKPARRVTPHEARRCIFGWTIGNDVTERSWQASDSTPLRAKNSDTFCPMGPVIATNVDPRDMTTTVRINGETVHKFATGNMLFDAGLIISYISQFCTLHPGDVVWLGTDEWPKNLAPGDIIEIEISGIGTLRNRVTAESSESEN
jgi:2-keto-4-pentenoate hydratase/2-oxohepta-3-ene-1,7-dioic acid hydratase in catechol pathway